MAQVITLSINGTLDNTSSTATNRGIPVNAIRVIEPYVVPASGQPISGVTLATVVKLFRDGTQAKAGASYVSATAFATVVSACNA